MLGRALVLNPSSKTLHDVQSHPVLRAFGSDGSDPNRRRTGARGPVSILHFYRFSKCMILRWEQSDRTRPQITDSTTPHRGNKRPIGNIRGHKVTNENKKGNQWIICKDDLLERSLLDSPFRHRCGSGRSGSSRLQGELLPEPVAPVSRTRLIVSFLRRPRGPLCPPSPRGSHYRRDICLGVLKRGRKKSRDGTTRRVSVANSECTDKWAGERSDSNNKTIGVVDTLHIIHYFQREYFGLPLVTSSPSPTYSFSW